MRGAAAVALIAAASVLGLAGCSSPSPVSALDRAQSETDVLAQFSQLESLDVDSVRHLADTATDAGQRKYFVGRDEDGGYMLIAVGTEPTDLSTGGSRSLPFQLGLADGTIVQLVPNGLSDIPADGWTAVAPNLLIKEE
ncbi:hypothetical protein [Salinibacterium sp. ZJ454]|uniref:hypothetical protein n=1 Tax=Salinibacterium sp. ZJ454 TaxID=2708339 RepID=UPI0014222F43|nr:hypothetical protein [Salinibacterium sp. ZJ454]